MKTYDVYILKCADNSYYVGVTNNLEKRIMEHKEGLDSKSYTFKRRPIALIWNQTFNDIEQAIGFEKKLKGWNRVKKEALINGEFDKLVRLSKNYTQYGKSSTSSD
ncbi:GIY-YIG nuclease family protein [Lutibacter sp. A80]|uniref:GIY-YIG nuclease family protein n=1 Tax=Lutibacter sp. A80 TaxID=2918453 RepID=UPI001F0669E9|nr:GIY-YIG nuclease family protein [Lutibacter sp. A80]UMB61673.1 GIY-YIG nuclease family protein [Lutibacter sp. A80]